MGICYGEEPYCGIKCKKKRLEIKKGTYRSSCAMPLWMAMAGKFCSTSSCDRATQRCTDLTKITT